MLWSVFYKRRNNDITTSRNLYFALHFMARSKGASQPWMSESWYGGTSWTYLEMFCDFLYVKNYKHRFGTVVATYGGQKGVCKMCIINIRREHLWELGALTDLDEVDEVRLRLWTAATNGPVHPTWYMSMENDGGMISTEEQSWFVHQRSLPILTAESSGSNQEERTKEIMNLALRSIFVNTLQVTFYLP
jgi:hypothetical protein